MPYSKQYPDLQDWDDPESCILWPKLRALLRQVRETGRVGEHDTHDHLNKENKIEIDEQVFQRWQRGFEELTKQQREQGVELIWVIVDGFVLYYDKVSRGCETGLLLTSQDIVDMLDIRIFLRVPYDVLKKRREERQVYVLQRELVFVSRKKRLMSARS